MRSIELKSLGTTSPRSRPPGQCPVSLLVSPAARMKTWEAERLGPLLKVTKPIQVCLCPPAITDLGKESIPNCNYSLLHQFSSLN